MPVYIIRAGDTDMVKIGWGADPELRRQNLQVAHWLPLRIVRLIEGVPATERWMQRHFASFQQQNEWFRFHPDMLTVEPPFLHGARRKCVASPAAQLVDELGGSHRVAAALGIKKNTVCQWYRDGIAARWWFPLAKLAVESGSPITVKNIEESWEAMRPSLREVA